MQIWKKIPGFDDYIISNEGKIKSLNYRNKGIIKEIKQHNDKDGYKVSVLNQCCHSTHRLVAKTFLEDYDEKLQVNHKNGIKNDNRIENLEMVTNKENSQHRTKVLKKGRITPVLMLDKITNEIIKEFDSTREAERIMNIEHSTISKVCKGKKKTAGGYKCKYKEKENKK